MSSPFDVQVGEEAGPQKVRAWGPGLETGVVGQSADFVVEAIGTEVGTLGKSPVAKGQAGLAGDTGLRQEVAVAVCVQASPSRDLRRPRLSATIKVTVRAMCATGRWRRVTTPCTSFVTMRM